MENFASDFKGHNGLTPEETFVKQLYDAFVENVKNNNLPFFNKVSNIPREFLIINQKQHQFFVVIIILC